VEALEDLGRKRKANKMSCDSSPQKKIKMAAPTDNQQTREQQEVAREETTEAYIAEWAIEAIEATEALEAGGRSGPPALEAGTTGGATHRATTTTSSLLYTYMIKFFLKSYLYFCNSCACVIFFLHFLLSLSFFSK
jgi:hypothetical protein